MVKHISAMVSDKDVIEYLDKLENQSEFIRACVVGRIRGDLVPRHENLNPLNAAKLEGVKYDNEVKRMKAERYSQRQDLEESRLRHDIQLKASQAKLSEAALMKLTAPRGGAYRYILAWPSGEVRFMCAHCGITVASPNNYDPASYIDAKLKLVNHMADKHGIAAFSFDRYTDYYFRDFELKFFGTEIPACPHLKDYAEGKYEYKLFEWPGPAGPALNGPRPLPNHAD